MTTFVQRLLIAGNNKTQYRLILGLAFLLGGGTCGYLKSKLQADYDNQNYSQQHLKQYISQDQVNHNIDKNNKPAVLYYYQPGVFHHYIVRHGFIRCSNLCHNQADFYLVNLTKKLEKTIPQLQHKFPLIQYLLEIRFPKDKCGVVYTNGEQVQKMAYRRQFFNHTYKQTGGVQNFLQENGILEPKDVLQDFFNLNKRCLFQPVSETQQKE